MSIEEWRKNCLNFGLPNLVATTSPKCEHNPLPDEFIPSAFDAPGMKNVPVEQKEGQFDNIKIADMKDPAFAAARFAPNKLARTDAAITYQQGFVSNYKRVQRELRSRR